MGLTCLALGAWCVRFAALPALVCPFHAITGVPCPTCGATRAFAALVRGDVLGSLRMHPLVAPGVAVAALYIPYALIATHAGLPRVRVQVSDRDLTLIRAGVPVIAAGVWAFLILDGR